MRSTFVRTLGAGERAQVFLDGQPPAISSAVPATLRAQLDDAVTKLGGFQVEQASADATARGETVNQAALRKDLYTGLMLHVGKIAKAKLKTSPDLPNLVVPSTAQRKIDFVAVANQFADAAAKHVDLLVQNGLPADFMTELHAAIAQVSASGEARDRSLARRKAATTGAVDADKEVRVNLGVIDSVLTKALKGDAASLADWKASKKIRQTAVTPLPGGAVVTQAADGASAPDATTQTPAPTPAA